MQNSFLDSWIKKWDRTVVFAGVFDPVHKGHISAAENALRYGRKVVFIPERVPQHKHSTSAYKDRLEMLLIATKSQLKFSVVDYPKDHQYVNETFSWLNKNYPSSGYVWLVGSDVLKHMSSWKDIDKLESLNVVDIIYFDREGSETENDSFQITKDLIAHKIKRSRKRKIQKTHAKMSSTEIRNNLVKFHNRLPDGVFDYIKSKNLYNVSDSVTE